MTKSKIVAFVAAFAMFAVATGSSAAYMFNTNLGFGMRNSDVKELQMRLNAEVGTTLPGTTYFGSLTKSAVQKYQAMKSVSTTGFVGPLTRAALNGSTAPSGNLPAGCTTTSGFSPISGAPCNGTTSGNTQTGPVTAMLATTNPASSTLVAGQATANMAQFTFSGNGTVTSVTLQRIGVSADSTPSNVYLFDGATRLTDAAAVTNNGMVTFSNPSGIFTVSGTKTVTVKSDIASGTSGQTVGVKLVSFMTSGATTATTAEISGNIHSVASATLATVAHNTVTPSSATVNPGSGITVWQDTFTISNRDVMMKRLALRQVGSAPASSFQNFKLYVNGLQAGTATGVDAMGYVTFDMSAAPVSLVSGSRVVRVDADIVSGSSRTFQFSLRQAADVDFVDSSFGVNITPTSTPWTSAAANTISGTSGGTLTIQKDNSSPSTSLTLNGNDVNLGTFKVTAYGEAIKIETLSPGFTFTDGGTANAAATLRNGRLLINGVAYGSTATLLAAGTSFTTNYTVYPGTPVMVEVHADVYDNDGTGSLDTSDTIQAKLVTGSSNAQRMDSLGSFNAPSSAVTANTLPIATGSMTLSKNGTYVNQTTTLPTTNFKIGSWNLTGSSTEDILLTTLSIDVDAVSDNSFENGDMTNMYVVVKNGSNVVAQPSARQTATAADNNFSINYTLPKGQNLSIELYADLADDGLNAAAGSEAITSTDSVKTDLTVSGISLVGNTSVTATSADTDGQTIAYGAPTLTATLDASSPVVAIVSDNQTIDSASFKFSALTANATVTDLTFTLPAAAATVVNNVMLYEGSNLIASRAGATTVTFSGLTWGVNANTYKVLTVKLELGTIGYGAGTTGATLTTTLTGFTAVQAGVSDASANDAGPSIENDPAGVALIARAAVPTVSQGSLSTSLVNAIENDMYNFTVSPAGGSVALKQLKFTVVVNDNVGTNDTLTLGSFKLFRGSTDITSLVDIHNTAGATIESTNSLAEGTSTAIVTWATEEQISTATSFTLKATPTGFSTAADDDYINVNLAYDSSAQTSTDVYLVDLDSTTAQQTISLQGAAAASVTGTIGATVSTGPNVIWSDISALPHAETNADDADGTQDVPTSSADWINGYLIQSMPLSGLTKNN